MITKYAKLYIIHPLFISKEKNAPSQEYNAMYYI